MKTKYILHGGFADQPNKENDLFFKEILKDSVENPKILLVLFSIEPENTEASKNQDISQFEKNKRNKNPSYEVAKEETFIEQATKADIIYLHGGNTLKQLNTLKQFSNLKELFEGKIIVGESAGAYALSTCFYSSSVKVVKEGLGLVPVKLVCHYAGKYEEKLNECPDNLEILLLPEYQYRVFTL